MIDVSNHLTALNPDVPDFQPGKIWKNENQSIKKLIKCFFKILLFKLDNKLDDESDLLEKNEQQMKLIGVMSQQKDKILIITPTSNRKQQQQNHERIGEYTPRARITAELGKIIDDGMKKNYGMIDQ